MDSFNINNKITKVFEIKNKFLENENIDIATYDLMKEIIELFNIDRIYISAKNTEEDKCVPVVEYSKDAEPVFFGEINNFDGFAKSISIKTSEDELNFINTISKNNYFSDNFNEISDLLNKLGYIKSKKGNPSEILIFHIKNESAFSFMMVEMYKETSDNLPKFNQLALYDIYNTIKTRMEKEYLVQSLHNEVYTKNVILENEHMPMCIIAKDSRKVMYFNDFYKKFIPKIFIGAKYDELFEDNELFKDKSNNMDLDINSETLVNHKYKINEETFTTYWIKKIKSIILADGTDAYMIYIKDTADYIRQLDEVDILTSAYSMKGFIANFESSIKNKINKNYFLCTLDIARFKYINDSKGFDVGNKLLKKIADTLSDFIKKNEMFCRIAEDKFSILFQCETKKEATDRINDLFVDLENMRENHFSNININYVCGVTVVDESIEFITLIDRADMSRKTSKGSHKNIIAFFDESMEEKMNKEAYIETRVETALKDDEFTVYLQPKFNLNTMKICGAEALVRWITPTGMIFPDNFIPLFEKNGFITTLDFIVYEKSMEYIRSCLDRNLPVYPISLNVSRNHIQGNNFINNLITLIDKYKIPIELLELEITESVFIEDTELFKLFIDKLKYIKIKLSIDDFGSAYSSLQTLKDIDIDVLKIDKGFTDGLVDFESDEFEKNKIIMRNIINLAKEIGCKVICEGIESEEQIEVLKEIGCELGQGYVFARPMPIKDYEKEFIVL